MHRSVVAPFITVSAMLALIASMAYPAAAFISPAEGGATEKLQAINKGDSLPNTEALQKKVLNIWIPIPSWLAGTWFADSELIANPKKQNQRSHKNIPSVGIITLTKIGDMQDSKGTIWQYCGEAGIHSIQVGKLLEKMELQNVSVRKNSPKLLVLHAVSKVQVFDLERGRLFGNFIEHSTISYAFVSNGVVRNTVTITDFDETGKQFATYTDTTTETRLASYVPEESGADTLKQKFEMFQRSLHQ
jgi:hypothetical protein